MLMRNFNSLFTAIFLLPISVVMGQKMPQDSMPVVIPPSMDTTSVIVPEKESDNMPVAKPDNIPPQQETGSPQNPESVPDSKNKTKTVQKNTKKKTVY
jgi:hypothetical protein